MGDGHERARPQGRPQQRRIPPRMRHGRFLLQHPKRRSILQLLEPQLRQALRAKQSAPRPVLPRGLVEEQPRILGRLLILDRRDLGQPQRRLLRDHDAGDPMDPEPEDDSRVEELRPMEGEVRRRGNSRLLGSSHLQADIQGGTRGDDKSADVREVP